MNAQTATCSLCLQVVPEFSSSLRFTCSQLPFLCSPQK